MIAIDTSSFVRFLAGIEARDTGIVETALIARAALLPPVVLSEVLSHPDLPAAARDVIKAVPILEIREGYWERAGGLRAMLARRKQKAALADCLIAQSCIDSEIALVTWDRDYRRFISSGLTLL